MEKLQHIIEDNTLTSSELIYDHIVTHLEHNFRELLEQMTILRVWQITSRPTLAIGTFARGFDFNK